MVHHGEQGNHRTVVALMKSAYTKAIVLTVGIKAVRVIPGVLPLYSLVPDPVQEADKPQTQIASLHTVNYSKT